jgi:hypothetical protein
MSDEEFEKTETVVAALRQDIKGEEHMSSVHAVTQDLVFTAKVASFYPIDRDYLLKQFNRWLLEQSAGGVTSSFIIYKTTLDHKENT